MHKIYLLALLFLNCISSFPQEGFQFKSTKSKITIPFQLISNLIIVPVELNGVKLNFLLDTGVEKTVLFSLDETDTVSFKNIEKIKIKGLGSGESIDALKSNYNTFKINDLVDYSHEIYMILDQDVNFSSQLGVPVHGIIGYGFFKSLFVEINYSRKNLVVYKNIEFFPAKKLKNYNSIPLTLELEKPYIETFATLNSKEINLKLLIDTGASDALWLFENKIDIQSPVKYFEDFLGRGFSGNIYGKRSRIENLKIGKYNLLSPTVSFPDTLSLKSVNIVNGRNGSIGSEVLKRFNILFDYKNQKMYLKSNLNFKEPFNYNMCGIEIQHNGTQWIQEEQPLRAKFVSEALPVTETEFKDIKYLFKLKPIFEISQVRPNSPAEIAGILKEDVIVRINGTDAFRYKLQDINQIMQSEEDRWITIEVQRKNKILKFKFQLKKIL
ncbi:aspartyl protease family protein [Flavobacterium sp.]|uniref:retropepsin-like aspartic protease n=1 Tax=Flavobacterium sp. TaxID=239 RepID=UPI003750355B